MSSVVGKVTQRFALARRTALLISYAVLVTALVVTLARIIPVATRQAVDFGKLYLPAAEEHAEQVLGSYFGEKEYEEYRQTLGRVMKDMLKEYSPAAIRNATSVAGGMFQFILFSFLSVIFSLLILWEPDSFARGFDYLRYTRVGWIYEAVVPHITEFFGIVGKIFEAQIMIAMLNMSLTTAGLLVLGITNVFFLSSFVLICGMIPVLGTFISSTPILLVALFQKNGGLLLAVQALAIILLVHALEAYVLNPRIMGDHLKIHPFTVLVTLLVGEYYFGIWGVLLGIPIITYVSHRVTEPSTRVELLPEVPGVERLPASRSM